MKNIRLTVLGSVLLFASTSLVALADPFSNPGSPTTPQPFSVACDPYATTFTAGGLYEPNGSICTYTVPQTGTFKFVGIYKGTPGNATPVQRGFTISNPASTLSDTGYNFGNPQVGDTYFAASFSADTVSDAIAYDTNLLNGSGTPAPDLSTLSWVWGLPPPVVIVTPGQGAVYSPSDTVVPFATFANLASYTTVIYTLNGNPINPTQPLPLSTLPAGTSTLVIAATNGTGHTDYATTTFMVIDNIPPVIAITSPANGSSYRKNDSVTPAATITDSSPITSVVYKFNGTVVSASSSLPLTSAPAGTTTATLVVAATDSFGNTGYATSSFTVMPADNNAPSIVITSPLKYGLYAKTASLIVTATVTDQSAIASTVYWVNGVRVPAGMPLPLANAPVVSKASVVATDIYGNTATSTVTFFVVKSTSSCFADIIAILVAVNLDKTLPDKPTIATLIADCSVLIKGLHRYDDDGHH
jgi:hypothetical protein